MNLSSVRLPASPPLVLVPHGNRPQGAGDGQVSGALRGQMRRRLLPWICVAHKLKGLELKADRLTGSGPSIHQWLSHQLNGLRVVRATERRAASALGVRTWRRDAEGDKGFGTTG
ncbi:hypothetical protein NHX12_005757 [Muraenolepis orangiensis]|uniref:Uncharacterized protein n=1 Tax=Muraenolepis orangiensis TaxID=630683 RepID=A0A9Q0DS69_9TELE|nr:hypothetical protein NHX12_005757 [Muraenolepis orangiensis]